MFYSIETFLYMYSLWVLMTSTNISIKREAYQFLKKLKTQDKSFSDVILSFKKEPSKIMGFFGILKNMDWGRKEKNMEQFRSSFNKRLE